MRRHVRTDEVREVDQSLWLHLVDEANHIVELGHIGPHHAHGIAKWFEDRSNRGQIDVGANDGLAAGYEQRDHAAADKTGTANYENGHRKGRPQFGIFVLPPASLKLSPEKSPLR